MKKIHSKRTYVVAAVVIGGALLSGCNRNEAAAAQAAQAAAAEVPIFAVNTTTAVNGQIRDYLALSGDIVAGSTVDVYSDVAGKVTRLYVSVGSRVTRDAPIAEIDPSRPGQDFVRSIVRAPIAGTIVALPAQVGMTVSPAVPLARISGSGALELRLYVA